MCSDQSSKLITTINLLSSHCLFLFLCSKIQPSISIVGPPNPYAQQQRPIFRTLSPPYTIWYHRSKATPRYHLQDSPYPNLLLPLSRLSPCLPSLSLSPIPVPCLIPLSNVSVTADMLEAVVVTHCATTLCTVPV